MNWQFIRASVYNSRMLLSVFIAAAVITSVQLILLGPHPFVMPRPQDIPADIINKPQYMNLFIGRWQTQYNNYTIFKSSWFHLLRGADLYGVYPAKYWDFFKYSPTFAFLMGLLAYLPDIAGLTAWNILNVAAVFFAIRMLPFGNKTQCLLLWFTLNELLTCLTNCQSNGIMCGLIIAAYACMEQGKMLWAALWLVLATYIKVYGAIGCCLFLFYPGKIRFLCYTLFWTLLMALLPLFVTSPHTLMWQYHNWAALMIADASAATGLSVNGWLSSWFVMNNIGPIVTATGILLFLIPFTRFGLYRQQAYRLLMLASMLIWVIIFNHKAESATYIIAIAGVGIWYFARPATRWRTALLIFVFIFSSLSSTDFFPPYIRSHFIQPYRIKVFPCIVAWIVVFIELMTLKKSAEVEKEENNPALY